MMMRFRFKSVVAVLSILALFSRLNPTLAASSRPSSIREHTARPASTTTRADHNVHHQHQQEGPSWAVISTNDESTNSHNPRSPSPFILLLDITAFVAAANVVINLFRPDPLVTVVMRIPRILWEFCIQILALVASRQGEGDQPAFILLVLALALFWTAIGDIFLWGPVFAFMTTWQTCEGGGLFSSLPRTCRTDYVKGYSRILASIQSTLGGFFYLVVAVACWQQFWDRQERRTLNRQMMALDQLLNNNNNNLLSSRLQNHRLVK